MSVTPAGTVALVLLSGSTVTVSPGATKSLPSTFQCSDAPGGALITSSTATGGCGGPGGSTAIRTVAVPVSP